MPVTWFLLVAGMVPTWTFVYSRLRVRRRRLAAWAIASLCAIGWPLWLVAYGTELDRAHGRQVAARRQQLADLARVAELEAELRRL